MITKEQTQNTADLNICFVEEVKDWFDENHSVEEITTIMYNSEWNYNNADTTSGQTIWTEHELTKIINSIIDGEESYEDGKDRDQHEREDARKEMI